MFCSVIIPTIGRSTLKRAVGSVLDQEFSSGDFEVIVVNDAGQMLPKAAWHNSKHVRILNTQRRERSIARNVGAAVARGKYLWFLDDDDWILPGALDNFWALSSRAGDATWLCGGIRVVDEHGEVLGEVNSSLNGNCFAQVLGGAWAPIQASIVRNDMFFEVGGFDPLICGTEDLDLCKRIALKGTFANTSATVACLFRGGSWETSTDYLRAPEDVRRSRDHVLGEPGAFEHVVASLGNSADDRYWYGRVARVYLSAMSFNVRRRRFSSFISRSLFTVATLLVAGWRVFSSDFWNGIRAEHVPDSLHFITKAYEQRALQAAR